MGFAAPVALDHQANAVSIRLKDRGSAIARAIDVYRYIQIPTGRFAQPQQIFHLVADDRGFVVGAYADGKRVFARRRSSLCRIGGRWKTV